MVPAHVPAPLQTAFTPPPLSLAQEAPYPGRYTSLSAHHVVIRSFPDCNAHWQLGCFGIATVAWILTTLSMGFVEWRMWYMDSTAHYPPGMARVGVWKVCIYHRNSSFDRATSCHRHTYWDAYLPLDIRVSQHLLLAASILGLLGKAVMVCALKNVYVADFRTCATYYLITVAGFLNVAAGIFISIAAIWNYCAVMDEEGISFPPSFSLPFKPDKQEVGNAFLVACLAAVMSLSCGMFFLFSNTPQSNKVRPKIWEM
ncbi:claudin-34 [Pteropus vampyrus]|uniref:Claudin-34 n=1 Tax=Pteropus vampyrus TaxID=132908 RepID=A0A6P3RR37_PTEVA|nr:claudin-34 [Pteropus vampyrus]